MGTISVVPLRALAKGFVLAPERYDPQRQLGHADVRLADLFEIVTSNVPPHQITERAALVLDTTHASEGFVSHRHAPVAREAIGSAKRVLHPGDVIISRLRPYLRQVAWVDPALFALAVGGNAVVASTEYYVLRAKRAVPAAALVPLLLCERVQRAFAAAQEGGHHPRFSRDTLAALPLSPEWIKAGPGVAAEVEALVNTFRQTLFARDRLVLAASEDLATRD